MPSEYSEYSENSEIFLHVEARLKATTTWAEAGYVMAWQQFTVQERSATLPAIDDASEDALLEKSETDEAYTITGKNVTLTVTKEGTVTAMQLHGRNILTSDGSPTYSNPLYW